MASVKLTLCLLLSGVTVKAQTFGEWFDQKNTQRKYLVQQIAAFRTYDRVLKAGYGVAQHGLGSIGSAVKAEFNLHAAYYAGLHTASPCLKNNPEVRDIVVWQQDIITALKRLRYARYYQNVKAAVLKDCDRQLAGLQSIISDGGTVMSDADRVKAINEIHNHMLGNYRFTIRFCSQSKILEMQKKHERNDAATLKQYYGND